MPRLEDCFAAYGPYHRDRRNQITHFIGVPLLVFSVLLLLPLWLGAALTAAATVYYCRFDFGLGIFLGGVFAALCGVAQYFSGPRAYATSATAFIVGWAFQFLGHYWEGRKPAFVDNLTQIFNAPVFLGAEFLFLIGWRHDLARRVTSLRPSGSRR